MVFFFFGNMSCNLVKTDS